MILKRLLLILFRIVWYLPLTGVCIFWSYYYAAAAKIGHIPRYDIDPYHFEGLGWFYDLAGDGLVFGFLIACACTIYLLFKLFIRKLLHYKSDIIFFTIGVLFILVTMMSESIEWYFD